MINTALLPADKDPMGAAIADYFKRHKADRLRVFSSQFDEDEIPVEELFRTEKQMPLLERTALQMATGRILDVGAGSGCHSLTLQEAGKEVHAIDISPLSVEVMKQRGVRSVSQTNLFNEQFADEYDTILMLMNGSGIIGKLENLPDFFRKMKLLLRPGGCVLMDSSNLSYLFEEEDGSIVINLAGDYYGEVDFQMQYKNVKGDSFDWLYIDFQTLSIYAAENGFKAELVKEGTHYDYLAKLSRQALPFLYLAYSYYSESIPSISFTREANSSGLYRRVSFTIRPSLSIRTLRVIPALRSAYFANISAPGSRPKG